MNSLVSMLPLIVIFGGMMWFMQRSQKKQRQAQEERLNALKKGDKVVTIGGLHGVLDSIDEANNVITIDCDGVLLDFDRIAVRPVTTPQAS